MTEGLSADGATRLLAGGLCPTTTYGFGGGIAGYDPLTGAAASTLYFPFSKTEAIASGVSRTTAYGYVLKSFAPTTYEQFSNSLVQKILVREIVTDVGRLNLRQCYAYDLAGNVISDTNPRAGLSGCL